MLLKKGKTNIKYLLIVVILAAIAAGGILWSVNTQDFSFTQLFKLEEKDKKYCQQDRDCICCDKVMKTEEKNICVNLQYAEKNGCAGIELINAFCAINECECVKNKCVFKE
jgi:hypothetical protein